MFNTVIAAHRRRTFLGGGTLISVGVHAAVLGVFAVNAGARNAITEQVTQGIFFFAPPPSGTAGPTEVDERLTFTRLDGGSGDATAEGSPDGAESVEVGAADPLGGETQAANGGEAEAIPLASIFEVAADSVYLGSQVDNPVAYDSRSAAPAYPDSLRLAGVEGAVTAQFVVDTTGRVEVSSFVLLASTHGRFTESVRRALPDMIFQPAELNGRKIKQLVQLPFLFQIRSAAPDSAAVQDTASVARSPER